MYPEHIHFPILPVPSYPCDFPQMIEEKEKIILSPICVAHYMLTSARSNSQCPTPQRNLHSSLPLTTAEAITMKGYVTATLSQFLRVFFFGFLSTVFLL